MATEAACVLCGGKASNNETRTDGPCSGCEFWKCESCGRFHITEEARDCLLGQGDFAASGPWSPQRLRLVTTQVKAINSASEVAVTIGIGAPVPQGLNYPYLGLKNVPTA